MKKKTQVSIKIAALKEKNLKLINPSKTAKIKGGSLGILVSVDDI